MFIGQQDKQNMEFARKQRSDKGKKRGRRIAAAAGAAGALAAGAVLARRSKGGMKALPGTRMRSAAPRGSRITSAIGSAASGAKKKVGYGLSRTRAIGSAAKGAASRGIGKARTSISNRATQFKNRKKKRLGGS